MKKIIWILVLLVIVTSVYGINPNDPNLIAYYPFDVVTSKIVDNKTNGALTYNMTWTTGAIGDLTEGFAPNSQNALNLTGLNACANFTEYFLDAFTTSRHNFSINYWTDQVSYTSDHYLFDMVNAGFTQGFYTRHTSDSGGNIDVNGFNSVRSFADTNNGIKYQNTMVTFIVTTNITTNNNNISIYLNGTLFESNSVAATPIFSTLDANSYFGCLNNNANFYDGLVDDLTIWNKTLNSSELSSLYNTGIQDLPVVTFEGPTPSNGANSTIFDGVQINASCSVGATINLFWNDSFITTGTGKGNFTLNSSLVPSFGTYTYTANCNGLTNNTRTWNYQVGLDNCTKQYVSDTNATAYIIRYYDSETNNPITANIDGTLTYGIYSYSVEGDDTLNYSLCIYPNEAEISVSGTLFYSKTGYGSKSYTFSSTTFDNVTNYLDLYLFNSSSATGGSLIVEIYDSFNNLITGANVKLLEYIPSQNSFVEISQCYSDSNGECIFDVELNTKFYIVTATATIDGNAYTAQSTSTGQLIVLDGTTIELHLTTTEGFELDDLYDLVITPTNTSLVGNTSYLTATFNDASNNIHTVCVAYYTFNGLNAIEQAKNCVIGSSGIVNYAGGYLLDRDYTYEARIYVDEDNVSRTYYSYRYEAVEGTFLTEWEDYVLRPIMFAIPLIILGLALYLRNIKIFAFGTIGYSPLTLLWYPNFIGGVTMTFIIVLGICILYLSAKKQTIG